MKAKWQFHPDLSQILKEASKQAFHPVWHSAVLNFDKKHNWRNLANSGWFAGLEIGKVSATDNFGEHHTWEVELYEQGGIMQSVEGASRWAIRISGIES